MKKLLTIQTRILSYTGILIIVIILFKIDYNKLSKVVNELNKFELFYCIVVVQIIIALMILRWHAILKCMGINIKFIDALSYYIKGSLIGEATPFKIGEITKSGFLLKQNYCSFGKAIFSVWLDRFYDYVTIFFISIWGIIYISAVNTFSFQLFTVLLFGVGILLLLAILLKEQIVKKLFSIISYPLPDRLKNFLTFQLSEFYVGLKSIKPSSHFLFFIFSTIIWIVKFYLPYCLAKALCLNIPFFYLIAICSIITLITFLPISIGGLGTREVAFIFFLKPLSISIEKSVTFSLLIFSYGLGSLVLSWLLIQIFDIKKISKRLKLQCLILI